MRQVTDIEIKNRLRFDNPWWEGGSPPGARFTRSRLFLAPFVALVSQRHVNRATVLLGQRRVGKTVLMLQTIDRLLGAGVETRHILFVDLSQPIYFGCALDDLVRMFLAMFGHHREAPLHLFFDEIQYVRDWEIHLKALVDSFPGFKVAVSGSAAAALRLKSRESGAGRFTDFLLPPLLFKEFLDFRQVAPCEGTAALNQRFVDYVNYGGFPEAAFNDHLREDFRRFIGEDIVDRVLLRDLPSLYGISDPQELNRLFVTLAYNSGEEVNLEALSGKSHVAKNTIRRYLDYLEAAFLIRRVYRVDHNAKRFQRATTFKVYLTNASLRTALFGPLDENDPEFGRLVETAFFGQLFAAPFAGDMHYARWGREHYEVDCVIIDRARQRPSLAIEVKWSDRPATRPQELAGLTAFLEHNFPPSDSVVPGMVLTRATAHPPRPERGRLAAMLPVARASYQMGADAIRLKSAADLARALEAAARPG